MKREGSLENTKENVQSVDSKELPLASNYFAELEDRNLPFEQTSKKLSLHKLGFEALVHCELEKAGIEVNGHRSFDIQIHDTSAYRDMILKGSLGFGESYMEGKWSTRNLSFLIEKIFRSSAGRRRLTTKVILNSLASTITNLQAESRSKIVCNVHYDISNKLYEKMLDPRMAYTCGYWKNAKNLEEAQIHKMDLICRKLGLKPGMKVLDIGCGFGSFMKFAAENYGVECVGYSLSQEQIKCGIKSCAGLPIDFIFNDYRNIKGKFDRIVSIGMMEAVGNKNFRTYMKTIHNSLKEDGVALIHTVGHNVTTSIPDAWVHKYIFPNGILPSISQIGEAIEGLFVMEDWHNFGPDYHRTLLEWNQNFQNAWPELKKDFSPQFKRMWEFYLLSFAGGFAARNWQLWHIVLTKKGSAQPLCRLD